MGLRWATWTQHGHGLAHGIGMGPMWAEVGTSEHGDDVGIPVWAQRGFEKDGRWGVLVHMVTMRKPLPKPCWHHVGKVGSPHDYRVVTMCLCFVGF